MVAFFSNWNDEVGCLQPSNVGFNMSFDEYQLIMRALRTYAVEVDDYSEVADIVNFVNGVEFCYKTSRKVQLQNEG